MIRVYWLVFCLISIAGCEHSNKSTISIGLNYAETDLGYRNSGALPPGKIFIWDIRSNELIDLRSTIELQAFNRTRPANLVAKNVRGIEFKTTVNLPQGTSASIESAVSQSVSFVVTDAVREDNEGIYTSISDKYRLLGSDAYSAWRIDDLRNSSEYKLLVLLDPTFAKKEDVTVEGTTSASGSLKISSTDVGDIEIKVPRNSNASCESAGNERAACFINVAVFDVFVKEDGNLSYRPASGIDKRKLPEAFRSL